MSAWTPIPTDASLSGRYAYYVAPGADDEYPIDLAAHLETGEELESVEVVVYRLGADGTPEADVSETVCVGAPAVSGSVASQRIADLAEGRVYRVWVYHGDPGNRRGASFVISVMDGINA